MGVMLEQAKVAGFPDRGETGLRVVLAQGDGGSYVSRDLGGGRSVLWGRVMLGPGTAAGGGVSLAGGVSAAGEPVWSLRYEPDARRVRLLVADGPGLSAELDALPWQAVSWRVDRLAGEAELHVGGVLRSATEAVATDGLATAKVWLGGMFKDPASTGEVYLDEWAIGASRLGPVVVEPGGEYADDPARWLVVYNRAVADSAVWAERYRAARGVPYANLLGLELGESETISEAQYAELATAVNDYLAWTGLDERVMGVLLGYRVPGYVRVNDVLESAAAMMHAGWTHWGSAWNPLAEDALPNERLTKAALGEVRLTARIDGATLADATALIGRAEALMAEGLGDGEDAALWVDPLDEHDAVHDWAASVDRMRLRLPMTVVEPGEDASGVQGDGFFWSWSLGDAAGVFASAGGRRVLSVQTSPGGATATTLRSGGSANWIEAPLSAGYAAAGASARPFTLSGLPLARPMFEALRRGWTLAEAWLLALPRLREGLYLVGDPLLRVDLPRAGWDVFGPLSRLEELDASNPSWAGRASETSVALPEELRPGPGGEALYVVRQVDEAGRAEASSEPVRVVRSDGEAKRPAELPAWPGWGGWRPWLEAGRVVLRAVWEAPLSATGAAEVALLGEVDGAAEAVLAVAKLDPRERVVELRLPRPTASARYRWRVRSADGVERATPRSAWVRGGGGEAAELTLVG